MEKTKANISLKIQQLKEALCDLNDQDVKLQSPFYLNHWLRTHKFDVQKAEEAVRAGVKWRQENNITDTLINEDLEPEIAGRFPMFFDLKTKEGAPFVYAHVGAMDAGDLVKRFGKERLIRHVAHISIKMEKIVFDWDNQWEGSVEDLPAHRTHGYFGVYDTEGFSFVQSASIQGIQFYLDWTKLCLNVFPSVNRSSRVVNASRLVGIPYSLVKPLVSAKGYDMTLLGSGENEFKDHVFSKIEPRILEEVKGRAKALKEQAKKC